MPSLRLEPSPGVSDMRSFRSTITSAGVLAVTTCFLLMGAIPSLADTDSRIPGVNWSVKERSGGNVYILSPDKLNRVDMESDVVVRFNNYTSATGEVPLDYHHLDTILTLVLEQERARLAFVKTEWRFENAEDRQKYRDALSELSTSAQDVARKLRSSLKYFGTSVIKITPDVEIYLPPGISGEERSDAINRINYAAIADWARDRMDRVASGFHSFVESRDKLKVQVQAYVDPLAKGRQAVHVMNYDKLPQGQLQPIDRFGFNLTDAEKQRVASQIKGNELILSSAREIASESGEFKDRLLQLRDDLETQMKDIIRSADKLVSLLTELDALTEHLNSLSDQNAVDLVQTIEKVRSDIADVVNTKTCVESAIHNLEGTDSNSLVEILAGPSGLIGQVTSCIETLEGAIGGLSQLPHHIETASGLVQSLADSKAGNEWNKLERLLSSHKSGLESDFNHTKAALEFVLDVTGITTEGAEITGSIAEGANEYLSHDLSMAPEGVVELQRVKWAQNDRMVIVVKFLDPQDGDKVVVEKTYRLKAKLFGLHRQIDGQAIFYTGAGHDRELSTWKLNTAVVTSWSHLSRSTKFLPTLTSQIGVGFHLAYLDQGEDEVEFGLGPNISLGGNMLVFGAGWNLSVTDKKYAMIGINLIDLLSIASGKVL